MEKLSTARQERSTLYPEIAEKGVRLYARNS